MAFLTNPTQLRVGGVPEYFTLPWHVARENRAFADQSVNILWKDYPGGTGAMMQDLREEKLDVAVALTEGVVAEIVNRQSCQIVQYFVTSPLTWGIHVAAPTSFQRVDDLRNHPFAISRPGSGSHLMTYVLAQQHGWPTDRLRFREVGNLAGAREALAAETAAGFLWEKLTTQPWVDNGEFRRVGTIDTPWPCFVVAARPSVARRRSVIQNPGGAQPDYRRVEANARCTGPRHSAVRLAARRSKSRVGSSAVGYRPARRKSGVGTGNPHSPAASHYFGKSRAGAIVRRMSVGVSELTTGEELR